MRALLDVNVLIALFDTEHVHHGDAFAWWTKNRNDGWASCPLTQNGFVRIISGSRYPQPLAIAEAVAVVRAQMALPGHAFWPDDVSLADPKRFDHGRLLGRGQITDAYLLALACPAPRGRGSRALAMLRGKRVEMPGSKHDNLPV